MLALGIRYLTGYATATETGSRDRAEWPPHPGRVFMALVAALYETRPEGAHHDGLEQWQQEEAALEWLEGLDPPALKASEADLREVVTCYVPVNDKLSVPANLQPRSFPKVRPHDPDVFFLWPTTTPTARQNEVLDRICQKVTRVGHSSSLVQMWVVDPGDIPQPNLLPASKKDRRTHVAYLRVTTVGCLEELRRSFNGDRIERFFDFSAQISSAKGKARKAIEASFETEFGTRWNRTLPPPSRLWPSLSITRSYVRAAPSEASNPLSYFDVSLLVLAKQEGPNLGLESTALLTDALRGAILKNCLNAPEWLSGHQANGAPSQTPHIALIPLGFIGNEHADGHLLGLAIAFPRDVMPRERGRVLRPLLYAADAQPMEIKLTLGSVGIWTLRREERLAPPLALRSETWACTALTWASVTPIVLNRHPKTDRNADRAGWFAEVVETIAASCEHVGLPRPIEIDIDKTSWHRGAPRSRPGPDGYPLLPGKPGSPPRQQIHVWMRFASPVEGPVIIGAGRFRGYGLCKPCVVAPL